MSMPGGTRFPTQGLVRSLPSALASLTLDVARMDDDGDRLGERATNAIPAPAKDDHEDVSWALSTAQTTWGRGEHADALKWLRRAAEAASEAEDDDRALTLAKAAAEIASSLASARSQPAKRASVTSTPSGPPPRPTGSAPPNPSATVSRPPPLPEKNSRPPPPRKSVPAPPMPAARAAPPARKSNPANPKAPIPPVPLSSRPAADGAIKKVDAPKEPEKVKEIPKAPETAPDVERAAKIAAAAHGLGEDTAPQISLSEDRPSGSRARQQEDSKALPGFGSATLVAARVPSTEEMDGWPTQALEGDVSFEDSPKTTIGTRAYVERALTASAPPPAPSTRENRISAHPATPVKPSQAVRVVVWRGPDGVHIAPYGTTVSAISLDALLVALDPSADLSTWLTNK